jgi:hypothetical protein
MKVQHHLVGLCLQGVAGVESAVLVSPSISYSGEHDEERGFVKMRIVLASMLALLLTTWVGVLPTEAASRDQDRVTVVYRGYTVSWSNSDPSDLRVDRAPGRAEQFPRTASPRSVKRAKSRVALSSTSSTDADSCTAVPDNFGSADFGPACDAHDACYGSSTDRLQCDLDLLASMRAECNEEYGANPGLRLSCLTVAAIYFIGVRIFGARFYTGNGSGA